MFNSKYVHLLALMLAMGSPSTADELQGAFDLNSGVMQGKRPVPYDSNSYEQHGLGGGAFRPPNFPFLTNIIEGPAGIGMEINFDRAGHHVVKAVQPNGPAAKNRISVDDRIISVNGVPVDGLTTIEVVKLIRGEPETTLSLEIASKQSRRVFELNRKPLYRSDDQFSARLEQR